MFKYNGEIVSKKPFGNGHINGTYLLQTDKEKYVLQQINKNVFKNPERLMENIFAVTSYIKKQFPEQCCLEFLKTTDDKLCFCDEHGDYWRCYKFIDGCCLEQAQNADDFYQSGVAFGRFQRLLENFPAETLYEIIPDFHNTAERFKTFKKAVENDVCGRAKDVREEIEFIKSREDFTHLLINAHKNGEIPLRTTHNDTKLNNVLLENETHEPLCVIDLDTIMPGFSVTDFGDAIRFGASSAAEDETDLSKVNLDLTLFESFTKGFLQECKASLNKKEISLLPVGAKMMTLECGMRFLTDYLQGDVYFKTARENHNLDRCRTQLKLVAEMENHWQELIDIVKKYED